MTRYLTAIVVALLCGTGLFSTSPGAARASQAAQLVVHEWGTFTSIAGPDGRAVEWLPQTGPTDLPCFVERNRFNVKVGLSGTVRMETPVLYFYAPRETVVNVGVQFNSGVITEWFPRARVTPPVAPAVTSSQKIVWRNVKIVPGGAEDFLLEPGSSHYYAARRTAAAPLSIDSQREKFLFYRGVGRFIPSVAATVDAAGNVSLAAAPLASRPIGDFMLFSNDGGRIAYQVQHVTANAVAVDPKVVGQEPTSELARLLLDHGLYPDEAAAMLDTWRDSWFEAGTRLIYIVPRAEIDAILPLQIVPTPSDIVRVFVGRMELVTPAIEKTVTAALLENDVATLRTYGRFLQAIGARIVAKSAPADRGALERLLQDGYSGWVGASDKCNE
jgi:hypothetical protein